MRAPTLLLAALVVTLGAASAAHAGERTFSRGEVREILRIIEDHAERKRTRAEAREAATIEKKRVRAAKLLAAFRIGAAIKAERARRQAKPTTTAVDDAEAYRAAHLRYLRLGGRAGSGGMPRVRGR